MGTNDTDDETSADDRPQTVGDCRTSWGLLCIGTVSYVLLTIAWFLLAASLRWSSRIWASETQAGVVTGAVPLTHILVALLSKPVADWIGPYRAIGYGMIVLGVAQVGRSTAVGFASMLAFTVLTESARRSPVSASG